MFYKVSNTAKREKIEKEFELEFKYPEIYEPNPIINGLKESSLCVITSEKPYEINYGIWGVLPEKFEDEWSVFQNVSNNLNLNSYDIDNNNWHLEALNKRRCLIIVTGFFTSYLYKGTVYPYYVFSALKEPISLAGVYNQIEDGFITCSPILCEANKFIKNIHNINNEMPLVIDKKMRNEWLDTNSNIDLDYFIKQNCALNLRAHTIAKEFYKNDIIYNSVLEPVQYNNLPIFK